jgi:hypothetical protein
VIQEYPTSEEEEQQEQEASHPVYDAPSIIQDRESTGGGNPCSVDTRSFNLLELTANGDWEGAAAEINAIRSSRRKGDRSISRVRKSLASLNQQEANLRAKLAQVGAQKKVLAKFLELEQEQRPLNENSEQLSGT